MAETDKTSEKAKGGLTPTHIILIVGFLAVIGVLFFLLNKPAEKIIIDSTPTNENQVITPENFDEVQAKMNALESSNMFYVSMNPVWNFLYGDSVSEDAIMENSELNYSDMFITLELIDTQEVVYQSPVMSPGSSLENIKLDKKLEAGSYSVVCVHHILLLDGSEETTVQMALTVNVLN